MKAIPLSVLITSLIILASCVATGGAKETKVDPTKAAETRIQLGMRYLDAGKRDQALRQFLEVLETDSKSSKALQGLALVHQMNGEPVPAEDTFKKAIKYASDKEVSSIRYTYALFLSRQKRYDEAMKQFEVVSKDLSYIERATSLYYIGRCAVELENPQRAEAAFQHALNLRPGMGPAALELADLAFKEQDYATAKAYLDRYDGVSEPSARSLWLGIRIERIFGNKDKEASQALALKNLFGYSKEYLQYQQLIQSN